MEKRFRHKGTDKQRGWATVLPFLTVLMLVALPYSFLSPQGHVRKADGAGTGREAYDRCLQEYASIEDRIAMGRPRPTDDLKGKHAECTALYNSMTSGAGASQAQAGSQPANARQVYDRCLQEYASMEDRVALGRARPGDDLGKKHAECTALYNQARSAAGAAQSQTGSQPANARQVYDRCLQEYAAMEDRVAVGRPRPDDDLKRKHTECNYDYLHALVAQGRFPMRLNGQESVSIAQRSAAYTADVVWPAQMATAFPEYYFDWFINDEYAGRGKSTNAMSINVPRRVGKYTVKVNAYLWNGKTYLLSAEGTKGLEVRGPDVTITLTRAGSNDPVNGWVNLGSTGRIGSATHVFQNVAPGTYTVKGGATGYKEASLRLAVREENINTALQLEQSANFTKVIVRVVDKKDQKYVGGASVTLGRETKQGAETAFTVVEALPMSYRVTAPGYRDYTGSVQVGRAKEQAEQIVYVHLERIPQGRIGTGMRD